MLGLERASIGAYKKRGGLNLAFMWSASAYYGQSVFKNLQINTFGVGASAGAAVQLSDKLHIEAVAFAGAGISAGELDFEGETADSSSAPALRLGAQAGMFFRLDSIVVGAHVGFESARRELRDGNTDSVLFFTNGIFGGFSIGIR